MQSDPLQGENPESGWSFIFHNYTSNVQAPQMMINVSELKLQMPFDLDTGFFLLRNCSNKHKYKYEKLLITRELLKMMFFSNFMLKK